jgi:hypothetical protein
MTNLVTSEHWSILLIRGMLSIINNILIDKFLIRSFGYQSIIDNPTLLSSSQF